MQRRASMLTLQHGHKHAGVKRTSPEAHQLDVCLKHAKASPTLRQGVETVSQCCSCLRCRRCKRLMGWRSL